MDRKPIYWRHRLPRLEQLGTITIEEALILRERPTGVTVVAALTMFIAFALAFLQIVVVALSAVGGTPSRPSGLPPYLHLPSVIALLVFVLSIGQSDRARWAWYGSLVFWVLCPIDFGGLAYITDFMNGAIFLDR